MAERTYAGIQVSCNDQGYMTDFTQWTKDVAIDIAKEEDIELTDRHWEVLEYIQDQYRKEIPLTIRKIGKSNVVGIKEFYSLFPGGPLKKASRIAGIPKPVSCI
ncbi:MAG TPA: TusE/DsrC/DsvC family sulfur relay protein [Phaeodactylibacter sp.]|nr:TusE/DsrC/DsvC family sulfur relay protein [Phaeodactylibacter sp.]